LTADGPELALELENERANIIKIESINVTGEEESAEMLEEDNDIAPGGRGSFSVPGFNEADQCNTLDVEIEYQIGAGESSLGNQKVSGTLTSDIGFSDVETPSVPENFEAEYSG